MRPSAPMGRLPRAIDCNGVINRVWPTAAAEHGQQKPYVMHGWPYCRGTEWVWSWTWLDDTAGPPVDLAGQIGAGWRIGDDCFEVVGVSAGPRMVWADVIRPVWARPGGSRYVVTARSPVVQAVAAGGGARRVRRYVTTVESDRFFGRVPSVGRPVSVRGREHGLFSVAARFAPPEVAAQLLAAGRLVVPALDVATGADWHTVGTDQPHQTAAGRGWVGDVMVGLRGAEPHLCAALAALVNVAQVVGIGTGAAYGYGSVTARPVLASAGAASPAPRPTAPRPAVKGESTWDEIGFDALFDDL